VLSRDDIHHIFVNVYEVIHAIDLIVLVAIGWLFVPAVGMVYAVLNKAAARGKDKIKRVTSRGDLKSSTIVDAEENDRSYQRSYTYHFAVHISQMAKLGLLVYLCDIVVVAFNTIGYNPEGLGNVSNLFAKVVYTTWFAHRIKSFKTYFLTRFLRSCPEECDKVQMVNRVLDLTVLALLVVKIMGYFAMETGIALTSIAAFGTTSTLMISLASQEIAKGVTNGIEMAASDRFSEGDSEWREKR
jgi:small-conductance mechanosensitive channel